MPILAALTWFLILFPPKGYGQYDLGAEEGFVFRTLSQENCELRLKASQRRMRAIKEKGGPDGYALCVSADALKAQ